EKKERAEDTPLHGIYLPCFFILFGSIFFWNVYVTLGALGLCSSLLAYRFLMEYFRQKDLLSISKFNKFELIDKTIITKDTAIYKFKLNDPDESIDIPLCYNLMCKFNLPIEDDDNDNEIGGSNKEVKYQDYFRYYTPISSKYEKGEFDLLIKSYPEGKISKIFASLQIHQTVSFKGPVGKLPPTFLPSVYDDPDEISKSRLLMISGGTGITPMLRVIIESPVTLNLNLLHYSTSANNLYLKDEIDNVQFLRKNFNLKYSFGKF
ncbi:cytochrome b5 reductase family protein, partial [Ascoidea rubescens DSM 1968]